MRYFISILGMVGVIFALTLVGCDDCECNCDGAAGEAVTAEGTSEAVTEEEAASAIPEAVEGETPVANETGEESTETEAEETEESADSDDEEADDEDDDEVPTEEEPAEDETE